MHNLVLSPIDPDVLIKNISEKVAEKVLAAFQKTSQKQDAELTNGKRFVDTNSVAKYLKCPRAQVYQLQHKGVIKGKTLPGSRRLYFDLDEIDAVLSNHK